MLKKNIFILSLVMLLLPTFVLADGMMIAPPDRYVLETDQKAVIFHDGGNETLVLSVMFQADAENFAWIIPTPARPGVTKSSDELFTALDELTRIVPNDKRALGIDFDYAQNIMDDGVEVIESKQVEYYDVTVLTADDSKALIKWLNKNGYNYPEFGRYILESYIQNSWYFTAVKIDDGYLADNIKRQLRYGHAIPLRLDFQTDKIVYPLRISSITDNALTHEIPVGNNDNDLIVEDINEIAMPLPVPEQGRSSRPYYLDENIGILLYVITDNKQSLPKFDTLFAGWINKDTIENLAYNDNGDAWFTPKKNQYFLTKLYRRMTRAEMTSDLYLRVADDNETVNAPGSRDNSFVGFIWVIVIGGVIFFILLILVIVNGIRKE
ncbi:hypothetical protein COV56_02190 [Candidatus Kuenenbacteria bacterium CG11_big_fil_rev_8_21_14_0_20_37_9]|uniref:DUF2330 domain-containing protein n=1 Tax=Candidatus Kuenenbacteria bacterium CG08_land_8_20_14_0_20_37_23 TaxID=1974617 RepID=A0A2M6XSW6_9BACT|nr:MAG: hypothetical protein COV56_02190 [Candidatus Kuenenbacteria bacterium CG11_big_fil_rev_8_21_14_0_20_37_9]PIU10681.1 MAG: hypothetical protein COT27_01990 [Candidatus Kuenenbacteria bacterium CG08_land_8_20_14_0_20_37_23]